MAAKPVGVRENRPSTLGRKLEGDVKSPQSDQLHLRFIHHVTRIRRAFFMSAPPKEPSKAQVIAELNQAHEKINNLRAQTTVMSEEIAHLKTVQARERQETTDKFAAICARIEELERVVDSESEKTEGEDEVDEAAGNELQSEEAKSSNPLKTAVRVCMYTMMGVPNPCKILPEYPLENEDWPLNAITNERLLRFKWDVSWKDEVNWAELQKATKYIKEKGAIHIPAAKGALDTISEHDLQERVKSWYGELVKKVKTGRKIAAAGSSEQDDGPKKLSASLLQSRQKSKHKIRERKYNNLPVNHELRDPKYRHALAYTLMSEDEDGPEGEFVARKPIWRSDVLHQFYTKLDEQPDPTPSSRKTAPRTRGEPIDRNPKTAVKLDLRIR
ncbi:hypothetical protein V5O48_005955 [Marasmius crinis-equi]|uniref:Uncharacterized protein n=1 Tax=Marasmius crinis-equi TaxID=585013 RepID=A0ABR3FKW2_9AGAR